MDPMIMPRTLGRRRTLTRMSMLLLATLLLTMLAAPLASAGKEGVYISGATYFTLEQVSFSSGSDNGLVKFALRLHNGGDQDVDFNYFGARVTDTQGRSYSATQVSKQNARVLPGKEQDFQFTARTASSLAASDLKITLFAWDYNQANYMRDLGALSVSAAIEADGNAAVSETTVNLTQVDAALASDASLTYRLEGSHMAAQAGDWNVYANLTVSNPSSASITIPAGLKYRLSNTEGQLFAASVVQGGDQPLLPGASRKLILQATVGEEAQASTPWSLEMYKGEGTAEALLGTIGIQNGGHSVPIGIEQALTGSDGKQQLSATVQSATVTKQGDHVLVQAAVKVSNGGTRLIALPAYLGTVQLQSVPMTADAVLSGALPAYLSPQDSTILNFHAVMPAGIAAEELQLVLSEQQAASSGGTNANAGGNANGSTSGNAASNASALSAKNLPVLVADLDQATSLDSIVGESYEMGQPLKLQPSQIVNENLDTSLMDFGLFENESNGYQTAVAKFKLTNTGTSTITLPEWSTELIGTDGLVYSGSLIKPASQEVAPNTGYMITYTYLVPSATEDQTYTLHLYDGKTAAAAKITLGAYKLGFLPEEGDGTYKVYPYELNIHDFTVFYAMLNKTFTFEFKVDMDVQKLEQLLTDSTASKLEFDLVDTQDNVLATQTLTFDGVKNGSQTIKFTNDQVNQFSDMYRIKVYERIETGSSSIRHQLADLKAEN